MSCMRSRMRSMLMRPSARASGAPGHEWMPRPNAMCSLVFGRSTRNSAGHSNRRGSRFAAPLSSITGVPAAMSTPPIVVARRASRKSAFTGLSIRSASSMKSGMRSRCARSSSCSSGYSARYFSAVASRRAVVSWPAANRNVALRTTDSHVGRGAVRVLGQRQVGQHVGARLAATVLDVRRRSSRRAIPGR